MFSIHQNGESNEADVNSINDELTKTKGHLALLRNQYVKLQLQHNELQKAYSHLKASQQSSNLEKAENSESSNCNDGLAIGLMKLTNNLYKNKAFSDLEIKLKNKTYHGHKFVLSARGGVWDFDKLNLTNILDLEFASEEVSEAIVKWLYTDSLDLQSQTDDFIIELMKVANKFLLTELQTQCEQMILAIVTVRNCIRFYQLAEELKASCLKDYCSNLISMHWDDLTANDFSSMEASILYTMLKSKSSFPLHRAIKAEREDVVFLYLIEYDGQLVDRLNIVDEGGEWPLQLALDQHQRSIADTLVAHKADINRYDENGRSHLHRALLAGNEFSASFLISNGALVNNVIRDTGDSSLHIMAQFKYQDYNATLEMQNIAKLTASILKRGGNPNLQNFTGLTPLHTAILSSNMPVFKLLLDSTMIDVEIRTREGYVPLWLSLSQLHSQNKSKGTSSSPFIESTYSKHSMPFVLIEKKCRIDATDIHTGSSLLQMCAEQKDENGAIFLAKQGANRNHVNLLGISCLHTSCVNGLIALTKYLLSNGADANLQTQKPISNQKLGSTEALSSVYLETALHIAIRYQYHDVTQLFLEHKAEISNFSYESDVSSPDFNLRNSEDATVLALAVWCGYFKVAAQLLSFGADINYKSKDGKTLLHLALEKEDISSSLFLLEHKADIHIKTNSNETPLQLAVKHGLAVVVDALCLHGADMDFADSNGDCALWLALESGEDDIASTLVRHGCDTNYWMPGPQDCRQTLLHRALYEEKEDIACFLIRSGCGLDWQREQMDELKNRSEIIDGQTPLHMAASRGFVKAVQVMVDFNAQINLQDNKGYTPLHFSVMNGHEIITEILLNNSSINLTLTDLNGRTPFAAAMLCKHNKCAQAILKREPGAAEQMDKKGRNFMHIAIQENDLDSILFLVSIGSDVNSATNDGKLNAPLHLAVEAGDVLIVRNLLLAGSVVNVLNKSKLSPLHVAVINNAYPIATVLIENGADMYAVDSNGNNVFHLAAKHSCLETIQIITQVDSQINTIATNLNSRQQTPLHVLAENGKGNAAEIFECFVAAVPDYQLGKQDGNGNIALLLAYFNGNGVLCRALVRAGSILAQSNQQGINLFNHPVATRQLLFRLLDILNKEPPWVDGNACLECSVKFGVATRKHHCRHCGRLLCSKCSTKMMPIIKFDVSKPIRVCDLCFDVLTFGGTH